MSNVKQATCPLCHRTTGTFTHNSRRIYVHHYRPDRHNSVEVCDGSGWLVEDDELVTVPRKVRSDAGIARPSRVWTCPGDRPECTSRNPCSNGCRWTFPAAAR